MIDNTLKVTLDTLLITAQQRILINVLALLACRSRISGWSTYVQQSMATQRVARASGRGEMSPRSNQRYRASSDSYSNDSNERPFIVLAVSRA